MKSLGIGAVVYAHPLSSPAQRTLSPPEKNMSNLWIFIYRLVSFCIILYHFFRIVFISLDKKLVNYHSKRYEPYPNSAGLCSQD